MATWALLNDYWSSFTFSCVCFSVVFLASVWVRYFRVSNLSLSQVSCYSIERFDDVNYECYHDSSNIWNFASENISVVRTHLKQFDEHFKCCSISLTRKSCRPPLQHMWMLERCSSGWLKGSSSAKGMPVSEECVSEKKSESGSEPSAAGFLLRWSGHANIPPPVTAPTSVSLLESAAADMKKPFFHEAEHIKRSRDHSESPTTV